MFTVNNLFAVNLATTFGSQPSMSKFYWLSFLTSGKKWILKSLCKSLLSCPFVHSSGAVIVALESHI